MSFEGDDVDFDLNNEYEVDNEYYCDSYVEPNSVQINKCYDFLILKEYELLKERENEIKRIMDYVDNREDAIIILLNYQWSFDKFNDNWFENLEKNKILFGLELAPEVKLKYKNQNTSYCFVCYNSCQDVNLYSLKCNHMFCGECWGEYLEVKAEDMLTCLFSLCPEKGCTLLVPEDYFNHFLTNELSKKKIHKAILKNFTESNKEIKICPNKYCDNVI